MFRQKYISDVTKIAHAQGAHRKPLRDKDILIEWWRVANVSRYTYMSIPDESIREECIKAAKLMSMLADLDFVYKTGNKRWEFFTMAERYMKAHDCDIEEALIGTSGMGYGGDCSATNLACMYWAGIPFKGKWKTYTSGIKTVLRRTGLFEMYRDTEHTATDEYAKVCSLYWKENAHVVMSINDYTQEDVPNVFVPKEYKNVYLEAKSKRVKIYNKATVLDATVIRNAEKGEIFQVTDIIAKAWYQVSLGKGKIGYIQNTPEVKELRETFNDNKLDDSICSFIILHEGKALIKDKPSVLSRTLGRMEKEKKYIVEEVVNNRWYKIIYSEDRFAYVDRRNKNVEAINME